MTVAPRLPRSWPGGCLGVSGLTEAAMVAASARTGRGAASAPIGRGPAPAAASPPAAAPAPAPGPAPALDPAPAPAPAPAAAQVPAALQGHGWAAHFPLREEIRQGWYPHPHSPIAPEREAQWTYLAPLSAAWLYNRALFQWQQEEKQVGPGGSGGVVPLWG